MKKRFRTLVATAMAIGLLSAGTVASQADTVSGSRTCATGYHATATTKLNIAGTQTQTTTHSHNSGSVTKVFYGLGPNTSNSLARTTYYLAISPRQISSQSTSCVGAPA